MRHRAARPIYYIHEDIHYSPLGISASRTVDIYVYINILFT